MILAWDQLRLSDAAGNTCAAAFQAVAGTPTVSADYPVTALYDPTSEATKNESFFSGKHTRIDFSPSDDWALRLDLGAARNVQAVIARGLALDGAATDLTAVAIEYSSDDSAWTTWASWSPTTGGEWSAVVTTLPHRLAFSATAVSAQYWRLRVTASATATATQFRLGYLGLYGDGVDVAVRPLQMAYVPTTSPQYSRTGLPYSADGTAYAQYYIEAVHQTGDAAALVAALARGDWHPHAAIQQRIVTGAVSAEFVSPQTWPLICMVATEITDTDATDKMLRRSEISAPVVVDRSVSWTFAAPGGINPVAELTLTEWR